MDFSQLVGRKLHFVTRLVLGGCFVAWLAYVLVGIKVSGAINRSYFPEDPSYLLGTWDIASALLAGYILLVALTGRWSVFRPS
jgi:hypothetical protein